MGELSGRRLVHWLLWRQKLERQSLRFAISQRIAAELMCSTKVLGVLPACFISFAGNGIIVAVTSYDGLRSLPHRQRDSACHVENSGQDPARQNE